MNNSIRDRVVHHHMFLPVIATIAAFAAGVGVTLAVTGNSSGPISANAVPTTTLTKVVYQCKPGVPVGDKRCAPKTAIQLVAGSPGDEYDARYECTSGYESIDAPVGKVVSRFGTRFTIRTTSASYGWQKSVKVKVELAKDVEVGGVIITTAAHDLAPTTYPQYKMLVVVTKGSAQFTLKSGAYVDNYEEEGITRLTFCLRQV